MTDPAPLLTPGDLRAIEILNSDKFADELLAELVAEFEGIVEGWRGIAPVSRTDTVTVPGVTGCTLLPRKNGITEVADVSIDGTDIDTDEITIIPEGLDRAAGWSGRWVTLDITHGDLTPLPGMLRACREFVRAKALKSVGNRPRSGAVVPGDGSSYPVHHAVDWSKGIVTGIDEVDDYLTGLDVYRTPGIG